MPLTILMAEFLRDLHSAGLERYLNTGERTMNWRGVEFSGVRKTGDQFRVEISFGEFVNNGQHTFTGFIRDITKRKRAEDDLRKQKEMLQKIFDNAPAMITLRGPDGKMTFRCGYSPSSYRFRR
jgi:PAS domain-containing protein